MADDDDDFVVFGTRLVDEQESRGNQRHKPVSDPAATRAQPLHKQEVTDEQGRRRFHGAFTGGFSAGYYNTVGSKEGWTPATFRSTRSERAGARQQTVSDFLDADELEEAQTGALKSTKTYDTFGADATAVARAALAEAAGERASGIGKLVPEDLLMPVHTSIGMQLLQKMGWRPGRGVGHDPAAQAAAREQQQQQGGGGRSRWGDVVGVGTENTPLYLLQPKRDVHGLGFDPFKGAAEFREARKRARQGDDGTSNMDPRGRKRKQRGVAFGVGALDEDDSMAIMDDYVDYHDDIRHAGGKSRGAFHFVVASEEDEDDDHYMHVMQATGRGGQGVPQQNTGRGNTTRSNRESDRKGLLSGSSTGLFSGSTAMAQQPVYRLPGPTQERHALQSSDQLKRPGALIPGFVLATTSVTIAFFAPPRVPREFDGRHRSGGDGGGGGGQAGQGPTQRNAGMPQLPPKVDPPPNPALRHAIDTLAVFVFRNGPLYERMALRTHAGDALYGFLRGGEGAAYYAYRLAFYKALNKPPVKKNEAQRKAPLTADERGALLGEAPLTAHQLTGIPSTNQHDAGISLQHDGSISVQQQGLPPPPAVRDKRVPLMNIAEGDRQRIQQALGGNFVRPQDVASAGGTATTVQGGLRPGAPPPPQQSPQQTPAAAAAAFLASMSDRFASAGTEQAPGEGVRGTSAGKPSGGEGMEGYVQQQQQQQGVGGGEFSQQQQGGGRLPVRHVEPWRPVPLLCKRLNVADPYKGKPAELEMSRFKTDYLALPDTVAAATAAAHAAAVALENAATHADDATTHTDNNVPVQHPTEQLPPPPPLYGGGTAPAKSSAMQRKDEVDDFLDAALGGDVSTRDSAAGAASREDTGQRTGAQQDVANGGGAGRAQAQGAAAAQLDPLASVQDDRPIDIFKAIFEDEDEEEDEDGEEEKDEEENGDEDDNEDQGAQQEDAGQRVEGNKAHAMTGDKDNVSLPQDTQPPAAQQLVGVIEKGKQPVTTTSTVGDGAPTGQAHPVPPAGQHEGGPPSAAGPSVPVQDPAAAQRQKLLEALELLRRAKKKKKHKKSSSKKKKKKKASKKLSKKHKKRGETSDDSSSGSDTSE